MRKCLGIFFISILVVAVLAGCDARTRYKTLSFFFDGVPDPDKIVVPQKAAGKDKPAPIKKGSKHGPYAAKLCNACHQPASNRLVLPIERLCLKCHELGLDKSYIHGPVAVGDCMVCHDPHNSGHPFLLVSKPEKLCFNCHDEKSISSSETHEGIESGCNDCHDAHSSDAQFLLR